MPMADPTIACSAMKCWKKRPGNTFSNFSLKVELPTSASRTTTRGSTSPSFTSAVPYASRVATLSPSW